MKNRVNKEIPSWPSDIISDLPINVVEAILMRLPIRDAVRTSILSRKWRYSWVNIPQLVFDDTLCQELKENQLPDKNKLMLTIYQVLLLHCGPVLKFTLSISGLESCSEIDQLILFLSRNGVEEINLCILEGEQYYKVPSSLFSCAQLTHLILCGCEFEPPPSFKGFGRLISIEFDEVIFAADMFESFISSCLLLERLTLIKCANFDHFQINAPKLKFLRFMVHFKSICFKNAPLLATVSINADEFVGGHFQEGETSNLIETFGYLPVIENLHTGSQFFKSLSASGVPEKLPTTLIHLKILELSKICFGELDVLSCVLCLIRSSPKLQKFTIEMSDSTDAVTGPVLEYLKAQDYNHVILDKLREVIMQLVSGMQPELEFIKLLLTKSPILETMLIKPKLKNVADRLEMLKTLTRFQRASPKAEIIFEDPPPN